MTRRLAILGLAFVSALALAGCSTTPSPTLKSVAITGPPVAVGATAQFVATATFTDGTTQNVTSTSTWSSSNTAVATVNAAGVVTGVADGTSSITANYQGTIATDVATVVG
jgi:uncharacterized protein YjdB